MGHDRPGPIPYTKSPMKLPTTVLLALLAAPLAAFADTAPKLTVRQAVELFSALSALDKGGSKVIDGKEAHVPFAFPSTVRWTLASDKAAVKAVAEQFNETKDAIVGDIAAKQSKDDPSATAKFNAAVDKALEPILSAPVPDPQPALKKVSLADLQTDTNPIDIDVLTELRPIISDQ